MQSNQPLALTALASGLLLTLMVAIGVATGVSQQSFELFARPELYARNLTAAAGPLRLIIGLDNIFIALYTTMVLLTAGAFYSDKTRVLIAVFACAGVAAGALDYLENHDILTMLSAAEAGIVPTAGDLQRRAVASMLKWHLGYFSFFLLAFAFPARSPFEKAFKFSLLCVQLPVGVFYYILEGSAAGEALFYARYGNLVAGFLVFAWLFRPKAGQRKNAGGERQATPMPV